MKITRRSVLKMFAWAPLTLPVVTKALAEPKPEPKVEIAETFVTEFAQSRPFLYLIVGKPKTGKSLLAEQLWNARRQVAMDFEQTGGKWSAALPQTIQINNCETLKDPTSDCNVLRSMGVNVVATVDENKDVKNATLCWLYGGNYNAFHQADAVIRVKSFKQVKEANTGKTYFEWKLTTLKSRIPNPMGDTWSFYCRV